MALVGYKTTKKAKLALRPFERLVSRNIVYS